MPERPYTLLSCAMSLDGCIDDASSVRLLLSNAADFDRVDAVRASCDAILVGAGTIRSDNPRLLVRSEARREERTDRGEPPSPVKVTVTRGGKLDRTAAFFTSGCGSKLVYCASAGMDEARRRFADQATVVDGGAQVGMGPLSADLHARGIRRLMVEGGESILTQFLTEGLADELQLVVAPILVGDFRAPRLMHEGVFPAGAHQMVTLAEARTIGEVVLLRYALSARFQEAAQEDQAAP